MAKFFEKLVERFFDFFNMGRILTIFVPGAVAACCFAMLLSLLIFPVTSKKTDSEQEQAVMKVAVKKTTENIDDATKKPTKGSKTVKPTEKKGVRSQMAEQETIEKKDITKPPVAPKDAAAKALAEQLRSDFGRLSSHQWLIVLLAVVMGFPIYEIGYRLLSGLSDDDKLKTYALYPYDDSNDPTDTRKLFFLGDATAKKNEPVGIMYFAPFLKEKFSGEENYFNFFVTEFYRFQEFSTVMPVSVVISAIVAYLYYVLFSLREGYWLYGTVFFLLFAVMITSAILYYKYITVPGMESYARSKKALVQGVSAIMSKGLVKP